MRVPDAIRKTVMFVGTETAHGKKYNATAYLVSVPGGPGLLQVSSTKHLTETVRYPTTFMLTAGHVAEKLERKCFHLRVNKRDGGMAVINCGAETRWWYHPTEKKYVDAAATLFLPAELPDLDIEPIPFGLFTDEQIIAEHNLGVGDEVFITGLFTEAVETTRNIPIVRTGTVAMMPREKLPFKDGLIEAHLIESRSIGGLSGSPVFVRETSKIGATIRFKPGKTPMNINDSYPGESFDIEERYGLGKFYFFGSVVGHWDLKNFTAIQAEAVNYGISPVTPAQKIREIILQGGVIEMMKRRSKEIAERSEAQAVYDSSEREGSAFTKKDFEAALKKASRRIPPLKSGKGKK